jgi:hypothetical protein
MTLEIGDIELKFNVGAQKATVYMPLDAHANDAELVHHFLRNEHVPAYLHADLSSALAALHSMALSANDDAVSVNDLSACQQHSAALARLLVRSQRKPTPSEDELTAAANNNNNNNNNKSDAFSDDDALAARFVDAYENISRVPYAAREVRQLEQSYTAALAELQQSKANALATLHKRQSAEMETLIARASDGTGDAPSLFVERLVAKHVAEVAALERRWDDEFDASKRQQRADYRADVINLYAEMRRRRGEIVTIQKSSVDGTTTITAAAAAPVTPAKEQQQLRSSNSPAAGAKLTQKLSSIINFGRRAAAGAAAVASPQSLASSASSATVSSTAGGAAAGGATQSSASVLATMTASSGSSSVMSDDEEAPHIERFRIHLGSQRKNTYLIELMTGDVLDCVRASAERSDALSSVYSDSLSAVVVLVDAALKFTSKQCQEFASLCNASTEFHFAPLEQQLDAVRAEAAERGALRPGEFFVTRHSTLSGVQVAFHFVTGGDTASTANAKSPLLCGLRNMLALAAQYDITTLTLPVLLVDRGVEAMMTEAVMLKRAQSILFAVKATLQQNCAMDNPLKTIRLVSPGHSEPLFKKFRELLS